MSGSITQVRPTVGFNFSALTISNSAVGIASSLFLSPDGNATVAYLTLEGGQVRYKYSGEDPTASVGHILDPGGFLVITGQNQLSSIKFIRTGGVDGTASITMERE